MRSVDALVREGEVASRSEAVRVGLAELVDRRSRQRVGQAIVDGYERRPQDASGVAWADASTIRMIAEEPW